MSREELKYECYVGLLEKERTSASRHVEKFYFGLKMFFILPVSIVRNWLSSFLVSITKTAALQTFEK